MTEPDRDHRALWDGLGRWNASLATEGYQACPGNPFPDRATGSEIAGLLADQLGHPILEVGCGLGRLGRPLIERGHRYFGLDLASSMLAEARRGVPGGRWIQGRATALPVADGTVGGIVCYAVLMHLDPPSAERAVAEFRRVLRPDGTALIHFKNRLHPLELVFGPLRRRGGPRSPIARRCHTYAEIRRWLGRHFAAVDVRIDSYQVLPLALPVGEASASDALLTGIPSRADLRFRPVVPVPVARILDGLFVRLARLGNGPLPGLRLMAKEFLAVCRRPRAVR